MEYTREKEELARDIVELVERDLKCYPDWIIRMEVPNLGIPQRGKIIGGLPPSSESGSYIEDAAEVSEEIRRKVEIIERVYLRLHSKTKDIIEMRYFQNYPREEILKYFTDKETQKPMSKRTYYRLRDAAIESFARAMGYID
jgi:hypothetical protein